MCLKTKQCGKNLHHTLKEGELEFEYLQSVNDISILRACQK